MVSSGRTAARSIEQHFVAIIIVALAIAVSLITLVGIRENRSDSLKLLVYQGTAFVEALTEAADNAIESERFFDYLVHKRYSELLVDLSQQELTTITDDQLTRLALAHDLYGIIVYGTDTVPLAGTIVRGSVAHPPDFVMNEVAQLMKEPENNYVLLLDAGDDPDEMVHYYIEISNSMDRVFLVVADALYYVNALSQTQIGFLVQKMAGEKGVEYIIYQSSDGIIFSSRRTASLLAIESDPFLSEALDSDTVRYREYDFEDTRVLELVRPFSTANYPFGLLRVGLSLENYTAISRGYDLQMIALSAVLFVLVMVVTLYLQARRRRREIDRQYREMKSISDKVFEEMKTGVIAVDARGSLILANQAFERIFSTRAETGKTWDDLITVDELSFAGIMASSHQNIEREFSQDYGGERRWLLIAISKITDDKGESSGLVAVTSDITHLKELERKSARKERLSEMGNLAAGVAHEIRNPLNTISIAAQRLAGEFVPDLNREEYLSFTRQIRDETKRLNEIITRFLALAREQTDRQRTVNLNELVREFIGLCKYEAENLNIALQIDVDPSLELKADPDSLKQVLSNLFNNSKEALHGAAGTIEITGRQTPNSIQLRFADSGPGIQPQQREKVFTPFYTTKSSGTGLGLPTVYRVVTDLGGDVAIEDSDLGGAAFVMTFPL